MKVTDCSKVLIFGIMFLSLQAYLHGQKGIFGDDYKKEMWKSIKPSEKNPLSLPKKSNLKDDKSSILDNKYSKAYSNYKYGDDLNHLLEITEPKYKLSPNLTKYNGITPLNELPAGSTQIVFMGGHFHIINTGGSLVVPSGISFSGGGRKKLSEKSKSILVNVYGLEIDE